MHIKSLSMIISRLRWLDTLNIKLNTAVSALAYHIGWIDIHSYLIWRFSLLLLPIGSPMLRAENGSVLYSECYNAQLEQPIGLDEQISTSNTSSSMKSAAQSAPTRWTISAGGWWSETFAQRRWNNNKKYKNKIVVFVVFSCR